MSPALEATTTTAAAAAAAPRRREVPRETVRWQDGPGKTRVRAVNTSNVYGKVVEGRPTPGVPFLGLFATESNCRSACETLSNCTQYSWVSAQQLFFF
jgi:hypothetical protein